MSKVSIVVPLFFGKKYLKNIISMVDNNYSDILTKHLDIELELILINDCNEDCSIDKGKVRWDISLINNQTNKGIHGSRIEGFQRAKGEWILFLDQDDYISDHYISSQMMGIENFDISICNGKNWNRLVYDKNENFKIFDIDTFLNRGNSILSPGMTLIRKLSIPGTWTENVMTVNGADDYLLWILMSYNKCKDRYVDECLYCHINHGNNVSSDDENMTKSVQEVANIISTLGIDIPGGRDCLPSSKPFQSELYTNEHLAMRNRINAFVFDQWLWIYQRGLSLQQYFERNEIYTVSIYGVGLIGKHLVADLMNSKIIIREIVDKYRKIEFMGMKTITIDKLNLDIDALVITPMHVYDNICKDLVDIYGEQIRPKIIPITEILGNVDIELD